MRIFKRIEVWLLLMVIGGAVWFVMQPTENIDGDGNAVENPPSVGTTGGGESTDPGDPTTTEPGDSGSRFEIADFNLVAQEEGGKVLEIEIANPGGAAIELNEENAVLADSEGEIFDRFFLPFDPTPMLDGVDSTAILRFWIQSKLSHEGKFDFTLEIDGEQLPLQVALKK